MVTAVITLIGDGRRPTFALRPMVTINLVSSGYSLEKQIDEIGNVTFNLAKKKE